MAEQVKPREYIDATWTRNALEGIFAVLSPAITAEFEKAGRADLGDNYEAAIAQAKVAENLAPYVASLINSAIAQVIDASTEAWNRAHAAQCGAMRTRSSASDVNLNITVTDGPRITKVARHDNQGRIVEMISEPLAAA